MTTLVMRSLPAAQRTRSGGVSAAADVISRALAQRVAQVAQSAIGHIRLGAPITQLWQARDESLALAQYDQVVAPNETAMSEALTLIRSLPAWAPLPRPLVESDGAIALDWELDHPKFFVVALDGTGRLEYSAVIDIGDEHYGSTVFHGDLPDVPAMLLARALGKRWLWTR